MSRTSGTSRWVRQWDIPSRWQQGRGHVGYVVVWEGESAGERLQ